MSSYKIANLYQQLKKKKIKLIVEYFQAEGTLRDEDLHSATAKD